MEHKSFRTNVFNANNSTFDRLIARQNQHMEEFEERKDAFYEKHIVPAVENYRMNVELGLMMEQQMLKVKLDELSEENKRTPLEPLDKDKRDIFKREYLGIWVEDDDNV